MPFGWDTIWNQSLHPRLLTPGIAHCDSMRPASAVVVEWRLGWVKPGDYRDCSCAMSGPPSQNDRMLPRDDPQMAAKLRLEERELRCGPD